MFLGFFGRLARVPFRPHTLCNLVVLGRLTVLFTGRVPAWILCRTDRPTYEKPLRSQTRSRGFRTSPLRRERPTVTRCSRCARRGGDQALRLYSSRRARRGRLPACSAPPAARSQRCGVPLRSFAHHHRTYQINSNETSSSRRWVALRSSGAALAAAVRYTASTHVQR